ncbi:MAG TPA: DUF429 domain-containing protein [Methanosarcina sp.]|jgi:predicted RNase H-like nuclease
MVCSTLGAENDQNCEWEIGLFSSFSSLIDFLKMNYEQTEFLILIDISIGLKNGGSIGRYSNIEALKILEIRKSSIFPVPCREAVYAESYEKACKINKELTGKSISNTVLKLYLMLKLIIKDLIQFTSLSLC